ncbi:SRPBCC domain-containing protein [Bacillus sp. FJAT-49705]|uniref:SRPBCC domain-containing protein n=1 Tax=Cytobacillus citreus TaxID=2833586 RepID=A0ABS5NQ15_9BACI|nr:SRPBCC domain-containing protein [Cytobacillus citreus]MBS4189503.1 SRPBCC domain-containing protein [Cytobacillus citreus]
MTKNISSPMTHRIEGEGRTLVLERVFNAPHSLVFQAFSQEEHLKRWFSPKGWSLPVSNFDFRPGGKWHYCMKCTDESQEYYGNESWGITTYEEIVEPERIVYVDSFSDPEGNIVEGLPTTKVTMTFIEQEGKTKLISSAEYVSAEALKQVMDMGMLQGVAQTWDKLASLLEELQTK